MVVLPLWVVVTGRETVNGFWGVGAAFFLDEGDDYVGAFCL